MDNGSLMRKIKLIIEYDGTNYSGWQIQPNGISIQQVVEESLEKILGEPVRLTSSGRTDAGVHARGMVATFKTESPIPLSAFSSGLNTILPSDIAIQQAEESSLTFNPRADAVGKHYRYTIYTGSQRSPVTRLYSWYFRCNLDMQAMQEGARYLLGEKDFASFRTVGCAAKTTIRRIDAVTVSRDQEYIIIDVHGSGFLRNMVRIMVGTLVQVGRGKLMPQDLQKFFDQPGLQAGPTAPAHGLCLIQVFY